MATSGWYLYNPLYRTWNRLLYRQFFELKLQSKKNRILRTLRKPLTSKEVDSTVLVDEIGAARLRTAQGITEHCNAAQN